MKAKLLVINGPNLNLLGEREPDHYGNMTLEQINRLLTAEAGQNLIEISFFQSNLEGELIDAIHGARKNQVDYLILNGGAYTHYSYAIRDAIKGVNIPTIEVHLSNIHNREAFRQQSVIAPVCLGQINGFGHYSYLLALKYIVCRESRLIYEEK